jgi:hypothetical protein
MLGVMRHSHICFAVKYLPEWLPGTGFKKLAREYSANIEKLVQGPFDFTRSEIVSAATA